MSGKVGFGDFGAALWQHWCACSCREATALQVDWTSTDRHVSKTPTGRTTTLITEACRGWFHRKGKKRGAYQKHNLRQSATRGCISCSCQILTCLQCDLCHLIWLLWSRAALAQLGERTPMTHCQHPGSSLHLLKKNQQQKKKASKRIYAISTLPSG